MRRLPLLERKRMLRKLAPPILYVDHLGCSGADCLKPLRLRWMLDE